MELPIMPDDMAANEPFYVALVAEIRRELETVRDMPELPHFRKTGKLSRAFFEHFQAALDAYDRLIDGVLGFDPLGKEVKCAKGCSNCCIDLVRGMTTPEIVHIYHHVRSWPDAKQLFEYHRESAFSFMQILAGKAQPGEAMPTARDPRIAEAHMEYNLQNRPCGFLDTATGCCRIYRVRPLACRYFFSLDPAEMCTPTHESYFSRRTRGVHLPEELHALMREIDHRFGFRPLNYLPGAFCEFAAEVMKIKPIGVTETSDEAIGG